MKRRILIFHLILVLVFSTLSFTPGMLTTISAAGGPSVLQSAAITADGQVALTFDKAMAAPESGSAGAYSNTVDVTSDTELRNAVTNANDGDAIILNTDISLTSNLTINTNITLTTVSGAVYSMDAGNCTITIPAGKEVTFNGNLAVIGRVSPVAEVAGTFTLAGDASVEQTQGDFAIDNKGTVTITDNAIVKSPFVGINNASTGTLNVTGGTIGLFGSSAQSAIRNFGTLAVSNGTIGSTTIGQYGIHDWSGGSAQITGGTICGKSTTVFVSSTGTLDISGGSFTAGSDDDYVLHCQGTANLTGGSFTNGKMTTVGNGKIHIDLSGSGSLSLPASGVQYVEGGWPKNFLTALPAIPSNVTVGQQSTVSVTGATTGVKFALDGTTSSQLGASMSGDTNVNMTPTAAGNYDLVLTAAGTGLASTQSIKLTLSVMVTAAAAPVLQSAQVLADGHALLSFNKAMAVPPSGSAGFKVTSNSCANNGVTAAELDAGDNTKIKLILAEKLKGGDGGRLSYTPGSVASSDGGLLAEFPLRDIDNSLPHPTLDTTALSAGTVGTAYSHTFTASGGTAPYVFFITGTLPGLDIDRYTGVLSGTPTTAGTFPFSILVYDQKNGYDIKEFSITVSNAAIVNVCEIGTKKFTSLDLAIADVPAGGIPVTIRLLQDITHTPPVVIDGQKIVFDLNGYDLTIDTRAIDYSTALKATNAGSVSCTGNGKLNAYGSRYGVYAFNYSQITVSGDVVATGGSTATGPYPGTGAYASGGGTTVTIDGSVTGDPFVEVSGNGKGANDYEATSSKPGYRQYGLSGSDENTVWVKEGSAPLTKEPTPSATFTATEVGSGRLANLQPDMRYSVNGGSSWLISSGSSVIIYGVTATNGIKVKKLGNGTTTTDSDIQTITVTQAAIPTGLSKVNCTTAAQNDGKLIGLTTAMEYKLSNSVTWTGGTGGDVTGLLSGTYYVRVKAAGTVLASENAELVIAPYDLTLIPVPTANSGLKWSGSVQIGVNGGTGYTLGGTYQATDVSVIGYNATATLQAGYAWDDGTTVVKNILWNIGKADGPTAPTGLAGVAPTTVGGLNGKITGTTATMEYANNTGFANASDCFANETTGLAAGTYYVRVKATVNHEAGAYATITLQPAPTTYSVTVVNGTGSGSYVQGAAVSVTANAAPSGQTFDKWTSSDGVTFANANSTSTTFTMPSKNVTVTATYKNTGGGSNPASGGSSDREDSSTPAPAPEAKPVAQVLDSNGNISKTITIKLDNSTGTAAIEIDAASLTGAFDKSKADDKGVKTVKIDIPKIDGAKIYEPILPASFLTSGDATKAVEIKTGIATVRVPGNMLQSVNAAGAQTISLTIAAADKSKLSAELQAQIGSRPVIELNLKIDGKTASWNNESAPVTVSIPYTPTPEELKDPEHIAVWYIDGSGKTVSVPSGRYDLATGRVTFTTTHFSKYAVAFAQKNFNDLESVVWAKKPIEVLASKGILRGISEKKYAPSTNITRADFLHYLVRTLGVDAKIDGNFEDISSDAYYYKEIGIAKKLGITSGMGNNKFNPDASITRQDMMALTERALRMLKKLKQQGAAMDLEKFSDKSLIAAYAADSVASLVKEGLIVGSGDNINPLGNTTRAEAAVFLYRIYNQY